MHSGLARRPRSKKTLPTERVQVVCILCTCRWYIHIYGRHRYYYASTNTARSDQHLPVYSRTRTHVKLARVGTRPERWHKPEGSHRCATNNAMPISLKIFLHLGFATIAMRGVSCLRSLQGHTRESVCQCLIPAVCLSSKPRCCAYSCVATRT